MLEQFRLSTFAPLVGDSFQVTSTDGNVSFELVLADARPLGKESENPASGRGPFSLVFNGPPSPLFPQATYLFNHGAMGNFEMFIVPIGPGSGGMRYEAVFT